MSAMTAGVAVAVSNSTLQKDDATAAWFAAAGEQAPVSAQTSLGYGGSVVSQTCLPAM
mgnify:CR=1 FL=1